MNRSVHSLSPLPKASSWFVLRFALGFLILLPTLVWFLGGNGPNRIINRSVGGLVTAQVKVAGLIIRLVDSEVVTRRTTLSGRSFSCEVDSGCNGMMAISLLLAGLIAMPSTWIRRSVGACYLVPAALLVNIFRLAGLYYLGAHKPDWFGLAHVYFGQVLTILIVTMLWFIWLTWNSSSQKLS